MSGGANGRAMKPFDPRLLRHARAVRGYMVAAVVLGVVVTGMVVAQAELLARLLASAARGTGPAVLSSALIALLAVVAVRAAAAYGGEGAALRAAAAGKSQLRTTLAASPADWMAWTRISPGTCRNWCLPAWYRRRCWRRWRPPTGFPP